MTLGITTLCHYAECCILVIAMLSVVMLSAMVPRARAELDFPPPKSTRTLAESPFDKLGINAFQVN